MKVLIHHPPQILNGVQFTMEFWQKKAQMPGSFNGVLNKRHLLSEVRLEFKDLFVAACIGFTLLLALASQFWLVKITFDQDSFDTFCCIRILVVIWWEYHWLDNLLTILNEPAIPHACLLPTRSDVHLRNEQCVLQIS